MIERDKLGKFKKGQIAWNKGTKGICKPNKTSFKEGSSGFARNHTKESKEKMCVSQKLRFKKETVRNKGKPCLEETKEKLRQKSLKQFKNGMPEATKIKISEGNIGEKNGRWNPNREIAKNSRNCAEYLQWFKQVKKRDKNQCAFKGQNCSGYNEVHHILPWRDYPEERYNIKNGIVLCQNHHPRKKADETRLILTFQELVGSKESVCRT